MKSENFIMNSQNVLWQVKIFLMNSWDFYDDRSRFYYEW